MAYFGLPKGFPWFLKPLGVIWSVAPFFSINLLARKWTSLRAKAAWAFCAAMMPSITLQALNTMFIIDPRKESTAMFFVLPFFTYVAIVPFLIAAYVFQNPSDND